MGNKQAEYDNDPYLNNSETQQRLRQLYTDTAIGIGGLKEESKQDMMKDQKTTNTIAFKNVISIKRDSLKLEKDPYKNQIYYISFDYQTIDNISISLYLNSELNLKNNALTTDFYVKKTYLEKTTDVFSDNFKNFLDLSLSFDSEEFFKNRSFNSKLIDLTLQIDQGNNTFLYMFFKLYQTEVKEDPNKSKVNLKYISQKLYHLNQWYDMHDVYGLSSKDQSENLCEICCSTKKNTIFLPCRHNYACAECAVMIRIKDPRCPICRQNIGDSIILNT